LKAGQAELNLIVYEEFGDSVAEFLEKEFGTPHIGLNEFAPFGLTASEAWFGAAADFFGLSHKPLEQESKRVRMKCYPTLSKATAINNILKGTPVALFGDSSQVTPLMAFLYEYLGMYPVIIGLKEVGPKSYGRLKEYIAAHSLDTSLLITPDHYEISDCLKEKTPSLVFGTSVEEYILRTLGTESPAFIPISFPYYNRVLLTMRPLVGFNGVLTLVEDIINSLSHSSGIHNKPKSTYKKKQLGE
jgi:nitrogenase molybdenum-iron protein alpha/beta subunit